MINIDGDIFEGDIKLILPWAQKIKDLADKPLEKKMLIGTTDFFSDYEKLPDPPEDKITHIIDEIEVLGTDMIHIKGHFLYTIAGKKIIKYFSDNKPDILKKTYFSPNMYALEKYPQNTTDVEALTLCTIDIIIED